LTAFASVDNKSQIENKPEILVQNSVLNQKIKSELKTDAKVNLALEISANSLLASVERSLSKDTKRIKTQNRQLNINALSLLADAEYKSEKSFLSKIFKSVQETSSSLVATVNSRNDIRD
jgi:ABC-type phosphate transport system auxiliary subunit